MKHLVAVTSLERIVRSRCWLALCCGALCLFACIGRAWAQQDPRVLTSRALFDEGRRLMATGEYAAACSKFEESQRLRAGIGTQFNLAECYEKRLTILVPSPVSGQTVRLNGAELGPASTLSSTGAAAAAADRPNRTRTAAYVAGAIGLSGLGLGTLFGLKALSKNDEAKKMSLMPRIGWTSLGLRLSCAF